MAGNKDDKYFESFVEMVSYSCDAAALLRKILKDYDPDVLQENLKEMHDIEHSADIAHHVMLKKLAREFITPIEREDIIDLAEAIDSVTDKIEDVLMRMYMFNIREVRLEAIEMADVVVKCCDALKIAIIEFPNFRKSKSLHEKIIEINHLEEEGDRLFTESVRNVYLTEEDGVLMSSWYHTLHYLEDCCDACEAVADVIESVTMKNS